MDFDDEEDSGEEEPEQTTTHQSDNVLQLLINRLGPVTFRGAIKVKASPVRVIVWLRQPDQLGAQLILS